jgi:hypothetical protein
VNEESVNDPVAESPDNLNTALAAFGVPVRSKRAKAEAERRAKKKYVERWHKSLGGRQQVCNVRGYRGTEKATGQEPAWNRPSLEDWAPKYPAKRSLSDRAPFAYSLSGLDVERMTASEYAWLAGE